MAINNYSWGSTEGNIEDYLKNCGRKHNAKNITVNVGGVVLGEGFRFIAGPCTIESEKQIIETAIAVKNAGAEILRGGAFKPRTSPYDFQGLHADGIKYLLEAKKMTGLPVVSEITDIATLDLFSDVDMIQVGARNMQNYELLKELGKIDKPVLLKRGLSSTVYELALCAEYIMQGGNENVVLCERGIRTFERVTRNTLDISAVPVLKNLTVLPVIVDPSHATGDSALVKPMSLSACACGADAVMIEVHNNPETALCDGKQSVTHAEFKDIVSAVKNIIPFRYQGK